MLLGAVLVWALNLTVTRYVLTHGIRPLAYASTRYFAATALFWCFTWQRERSFRIRLSDAGLVALAAALICVNQIAFVVAVHLTTASTVGLLLGTTPIFVGVLATAVGLERLHRGFWLAALASSAGVAAIAVGGGSGVSGGLVGVLVALLMALSWGAYSVSIAPLMRRYSPFRISALVLGLGWVPLALISIPQLAGQHIADVGWQLALSFAFSVVGPIFLTNILWFTAIARVGPARAALFANIQPFFAVLFALVLLSEHLNRWEIAGGIAIGLGIVFDRWRNGVPEPAVLGGMPAE